VPRRVLKTEPYSRQVERWPKEGRVILAQYDEGSVVVYQAYRSSIGRFAAENRYFGGDFSLSRMTWIKPNFLWMMYRSGWGCKEGQEVILAIRILREAFDEILSLAVHSTYERSVYNSNDEWKSKVQNSEIRLQWDPDHDPFGNSVKRRAIQLGIRGNAIKKYAKDWIVSIDDISEFVRDQRILVENNNLNRLETPNEEVYVIKDSSVSHSLGISEIDVI
jgi:hypothetical protein